MRNLNIYASMQTLSAKEDHVTLSKAPEQLMLVNVSNICIK